MKRYFEELDGLSFSPKEKDALTEILVKGRRGGQTDCGTAVPYRRMAAAVAAVSLLAGAAGAVSLAGISPEFRSMFGISDKNQAEKLAATSVQQTFWDQNGSGASLTVKEVVWDQRSVYALMEFQAPEGDVLPQAEGTPEGRGDYWFTGAPEERRPAEVGLYTDETKTEGAIFSGYWWGIDSLPDENPTDNRISLMFHLTFNKKVPEHLGYCTLENLSQLRIYSGETGDWAPVVYDNLEFDIGFPLTSMVKSYSFTGRSSVMLDGTMPAVVEELSLSPFSLSFSLLLTTEDACEYVNAAGEQAPWRPYILLKSGTKVYTKPGDTMSLSWHSDAEKQFLYADASFYFQFETPIDLAEIEEIVFPGDNDPAEELPNGGIGHTVLFLFYPGKFENETYWTEVNPYWRQSDGEMPDAPEATSQIAK
ncbi:DUF4179 domain-containing protein [Pseudoflavonifractor sp. 524-17]|uniref:DUF4179 domain-containing protein n=1 Tax=Pseudoflavonifractor sp. 524-17 TaxID=2304577 RepID=UPI00137B33F7|nr:DUF4179 domain-containing protein [Pseudoflavonifractor sp. 524-17]NCE65221.1 DUF4179 domain-containing protein [Pseudoflavonifractor sp. 524-17]